MNICEIVTSQCELVWNRIPGKKAPAAVALQWYKPDGDVLPAQSHQTNPDGDNLTNQPAKAPFPSKSQSSTSGSPSIKSPPTNLHNPPFPTMTPVMALLDYSISFTLEGCFRGKAITWQNEIESNQQ